MKRLKELRESKGLSQEELAEKIGVTKETIQLWEAGEKLPNDWEISLLLDILDCSLPYLQGISNQNVPPSGRIGPYTPITCPRCGSRELAFVTEYHKSIKTRALELIAIIVLCISACYYIPEILTLIFTSSSNSSTLENTIQEFIIFVIIYFAIKLLRMYIESKTHVLAICKDCGLTWLHNYP